MIYAKGFWRFFVKFPDLDEAIDDYLEKRVLGKKGFETNGESLLCDFERFGIIIFRIIGISGCISTEKGGLLLKIIPWQNFRKYGIKTSMLSSLTSKVYPISCSLRKRPNPICSTWITPTGIAP